METLNYHHLLYFWVVAREGSIARATEQLNLTQPTISAQIKALEESLGEELFARVGRRLELTDVGKTVFGYADAIFNLGRELRENLAGRPTGRPPQFTVGVADVVPKLIAWRLLRPAFDGPERLHVVCREDQPERLIDDLAQHEIDLVIAESPASRPRVFNHLLGESGVTLFAEAKLVGRRPFPQSLDGAPLLLPPPTTELRRQLDLWFERNKVRPAVIGEFQDNALMNVFGSRGLGIFPGSTAIAAEITAQFRVRVVGHIPEIRERFYAISAERKLRHAAVVAITETARSEIFVS